jgi:hypothetical protein
MHFDVFRASPLLRSKAVLESRAREFHRTDHNDNPQVPVNVLSFTKYRVTVLGNVQKAGMYDFPGREKLMLLEAIWTRQRLHARPKLCTRDREGSR